MACSCCYFFFITMMSVRINIALKSMCFYLNMLCISMHTSRGVVLRGAEIAVVSGPYRPTCFQSCWLTPRWRKHVLWGRKKLISAKDLIESMPGLPQGHIVGAIQKAWSLLMNGFKNAIWLSRNLRKGEHVHPGRQQDDPLYVQRLFHLGKSRCQ